jgi:hypothetical protein
MADGFESSRTEAYFSGRLRPGKLPRRLKAAEQSQSGKTCADTEKPRSRN